MVGAGCSGGQKRGNDVRFSALWRGKASWTRRDSPQRVQAVAQPGSSSGGRSSRNGKSAVGRWRTLGGIEAVIQEGGLVSTMGWGGSWEGELV